MKFCLCASSNNHPPGGGCSRANKFDPLTLFGCSEAVIPGHVLDVIDEGRIRQQISVLVDSVDGVFERQFDARVLLVFGEYRTWKSGFMTRGCAVFLSAVWMPSLSNELFPLYALNCQGVY